MSEERKSFNTGRPESQASRGVLSRISLQQAINSSGKVGGVLASNGQQLSAKAHCQCTTPFLQAREQEPQIMIVDDNTFNLLPLELILGQLCGLPCHKAFNGLEAVNFFKQSLAKANQVSEQQCLECGLTAKRAPNAPSMSMPQYKLIFMDLNMPIMDGYEATS